MKPRGWRTALPLRATKREGTAGLRRTTRGSRAHVQGVGLDAKKETPAPSRRGSVRGRRAAWPSRGASRMARKVLPVKRLLLLLILVFLPFSAFGQTDVLTHRNDNMRTGQNTSESVLTPSSVNSTAFGKLLSLPTDGYVYAQPLYKSNVLIPAKGLRNVLFVATEHDSVYAFDANGVTTTPLW